MHRGSAPALAKKHGALPAVDWRQGGGVRVLNAKLMKTGQAGWVSEPHVKRCAISKYDPGINSCKWIITGSLKNTLKIYDTTKEFEGNNLEIPVNGQFIDPDPKLGGAAHDGHISGVEFSEDGKKVLSASGDGYVKLWDMEKKQLVTTFKGHHDGLSGVACHPSDENLFCSSSFDKSCRVWDKRVGCVRNWMAGGEINCCTFAGEHGTLIAAGCEYASWEVWDSACNLQVARGTVKPGVRCASVASCKSGRVLYLGCGNLNKTGGYLFMADTFTPSATKKIDGHTGQVSCLSLDPQGAGLLSASFDGSVRLWGAKNNNPQAQIARNQIQPA